MLEVGGREGAGTWAPLGVSHLPLPARTWAEKSREKWGGLTLTEPLHRTQDRRREMSVKCMRAGVQRWV